MSQGFNNIKNIAKTGLEYSPYIGDAIDIGEGLYQATHGHPFLGSGQAALGLGGMAANFMFPGAGSVGKAAVKGAAKGAAKKIAKGTAKKVAKQEPSLLERFADWNRSGMGMAQSTALPNVGYWISDELKKPQTTNTVGMEDNNNSNRSTASRNTGGQPTTQEQALALAQQLGSNPLITSQQDVGNQQANIDAINDYVSRLQEINKPYIDALQNYSDRYNNLVKNNFNAQRYFTAMAGLTGNNNYARLADSINPLVVEGNKIDLQKKIQDAQAGDLNAINEIMGNLAVAQKMGLSPEAAFANKNLLTAMTMSDRNLTNREIAQLNNAAKLQVALQNAQNRLAVQNLRNQGGMTNALIYAGQYGQPAPGLSQQGTVGNVPASYNTMLQAAHNKNNR